MSTESSTIIVFLHNALRSEYPLQVRRTLFSFVAMKWVLTPESRTGSSVARISFLGGGSYFELKL
jgi:hypothetical protein